ncbi:hypothetical protein F6X40_35455 [Paraburkholderia sp. UCT31]|uniref:hypothetical protein n=1 Tax=Paraburkholderia sp. UCT31 TaxID=2615209 RepID=UPI0016556E53|nr:hypothetical protein [Paraburkholderia sp. UCT31]MBC8741847.1 hypothetical protein [Paraburkholderia sp. UCT31]
MMQTFIDEIDAAQAGEAWLIPFAREHGADQIEMLAGATPGGVRSAWKGRRLLGYYVVLRDGLNWTVLVTHDLVSQTAEAASPPSTS